MNKHINRTTVLLGVLIYSLVLTASSCKSPSDTVYKTSSGTHITVTAALAAWNDYIKTHEVSVEQELIVQKAFDKYKSAQLALLDTAIVIQKNPAITNTFEVVVVDVSAALSELLSLLRSYGVKF